MFAALLAIVLVSCAYGSERSPLTIYSAAHAYVGGQNYPAFSYPLIPVQYGPTPLVVPSPVAPGAGYIQGAGAYPMVHAGIPTVREIYNRPFVLVTRSQAGGRQMTACLVADGLISLEDNPCARQVQQQIQAGKQKKAFLFHPHGFDVRRLYPAKNFTVNKFQIPQNLTLKELAKIFSYRMPYLLVQDPEEFNNNIRTLGVVKIAEFDASLQPVNPEYYPTGNYQQGKMMTVDTSDFSMGVATIIESTIPGMV